MNNLHNEVKENLIPFDGSAAYMGMKTFTRGGDPVEIDCVDYISPDGRQRMTGRVFRDDGTQLSTDFERNGMFNKDGTESILDLFTLNEPIF